MEEHIETGKHLKLADTISRSTTSEELAIAFIKCRADGPVYECSCCENAWYCEGVKYAKNLERNDMVLFCFTGRVSEQEVEWVCLILVYSKNWYQSCPRIIAAADKDKNHVGVPNCRHMEKTCFFA
eukprot:Lithocolla_globosa_v1_NODE_3434_length_1669_cov_48.863693.p2 type:complete len:126 gc:universal NODE_3434_length_1669_cov_48.863693:1669-1292(-)